MTDDSANLAGVQPGPLHLVILQPTGFCNIDCDYCYLPNRSDPRKMSLDVVEGVAELLSRTELLADEVEFRWHAGEPLTVKPDFYAEACALLLDRLAPHSDVRFSLQTNGTLIDRSWCELFEQFGIGVGLSIDGPAHIHDAHRRTRRGTGSFERAMAGLEVLRNHGIPFEIISVVTEMTLAHRGEYLDFIAELAPWRLRINPEETEGEHRSELFAREDFERDYRAFLAELHRFGEATGIEVRRLASMRNRILRSQLPIRNDQVEPLMLLNVDVDGNLSTFSPELLGWQAPHYDDFSFGNVQDPEVALDSWGPNFRRLAAAIAEGKRMCERHCGYFPLCGGGAAVNKWTENGSFSTTETNACRSNIMAVADTVLAALEAEAAAGAGATRDPAPLNRGA